jgi:ATP-dependent DNA ligase
MLVRRDAAGVRLFTRNGHDWTGRFGENNPNVTAHSSMPRHSSEFWAVVSRFD